MARSDDPTDFAGTEEEYKVEDNKPSETAGDQSHEDPWQYADLDAPHSPPTDEVEE